MLTFLLHLDAEITNFYHEDIMLLKNKKINGKEE